MTNMPEQQKATAALTGLHCCMQGCLTTRPPQQSRRSVALSIPTWVSCARSVPVVTVQLHLCRDADASLWNSDEAKLLYLL